MIGTVFRKLDLALTVIERWVAGLTIGIAALFCFIEVILRYLFNYSIAGIEELIRFLIIWSVFVGGSLAIKRDEHISVDLITSMVSDKIRAVMRGIAFLLGAVFALIIMYQGFIVVQQTIEIGEISLSSLAIPMYIPRAAICVGGLLMGIRFIQQSYESFISIKQL